jgi:NMD protein affecting ribosome stability and mRNA decay
MDFFFASKQAGAKFNAFLASVVPTATKESGRVIGISHHVRFRGTKGTPLTAAPPLSLC